MKKETGLGDRFDNWCSIIFRILLLLFTLILLFCSLFFGGWLMIKGIKFIMFELGL